MRAHARIQDNSNVQFKTAIMGAWRIQQISSGNQAVSFISFIFLEFLAWQGTMAHNQPL